MLKTDFQDTGALSHGSPKPRATITVQPSHCAMLVPAVPEVYEMLCRPVIEFGESDTHYGQTMRLDPPDQMTPVFTRRSYDPDERRFVRTSTQTFPQGLVPIVSGWLRELGYDVVVEDRREDSPRWKLAENWKEFTPKLLRPVMKAVVAERALGVVTPNIALIVDTIVAVAAAYPAAKIAVAVGTKKQLKAILKRLRQVFRDEPLGLYTASVKSPARVSVGMIRRFPRGENGAFDLLVLPYVERTLTDEALDVVTSGQFRRVLSFSPDWCSSDANIEQRFAVVAGSFYPPEKVDIPLTVAVLATPGTKPTGTFEDKLDEVRQLYERNKRRNRHIAHVGTQLALARKGSVRSVVGDGMRANELLAAAKAGVLIMVHSQEHAAELAKLLPGWAVWTEMDVRVESPTARCGVIATEMGALMGMWPTAGVMILATGTNCPYPAAYLWPPTSEVERGFIIDFADEYHPKALKNARRRVASYEKSDIPVWVPHDKVSAKV